MVSTETIVELERLAGSDVGRNIEPLVTASQGGLAGAANSLLCGGRSVLIATGVFISWSETPAAETDGPPGALMLARTLRALGREVTLITDKSCAPVLDAVNGDIDPFPLVVVDSPDSLQKVVQRQRAQSAWTHVVAVERLGAASDGVTRFMDGRDVGSSHVPFEPLFRMSDVVTIAIGDGGNELGMGAIPERVFHDSVAQGPEIACATAADHLIVAGVSNWGAAALGLAIGSAAGELATRAIAPVCSAEHEMLVRRAVEVGGAVDGVSGRPEISVDGLGLDQVGMKIDAMTKLVAKSFGDGQ